MKVTVEIVLEGKITLRPSVEVKTLADVKKLGKKLQDQAAGVRKVLPDLLAAPVEKLRIVTE